jgi:AbrB family looped-hinge helix DNA binding protein
MSTTMSKEVLVTRKGQTTIPVELRIKYKITEGTRLVVVDTGDGIMFKRALTTADLAGSGSSSSTPEEMKANLDRLRDEDL